MEKTLEIYNDILTNEEAKAVESLVLLLDKKKVEYNKAGYNSSKLVKFLRARKLDLNKSFEMFTSYLKWRKENNIDSIASFAFPEMDLVKVYYPHGFHKTDRQGRPIYVDLLGEIKIDFLLKVTTNERLVQYQIRNYERLMNHVFPSCSAEGKKYIYQTCNVIDLKKLSADLLNKKSYGMLKKIAQVSQNYYPETLGQLFIINTGMLFKAAWAVCKAFLDQKTRDKIIPLGNEYKTKLFEHIDPDNLPKLIGGNCVCQPYGCLYSDAGPWNKDNQTEAKYNTELINKISIEDDLQKDGNKPEEPIEILEEHNDPIYLTEDQNNLDSNELSKEMNDKLKLSKASFDNDSKSDL